MLRSLFNIVAALEVSVIWYLTMYAYARLPSQIVTRLSQSGVAIAVGSKNTVLLLPIIITILFAALTMISVTNPGRYSYMFQVSLKDANNGAHAQMFVAISNCLTSAIFLVLQQMTFQTARLMRPTSGVSIIIGLVVLMVFSFIYYVRTLQRGST